MVSSFRYPLAWLNFSSLNTLSGWFQADSIILNYKRGTFTFGIFPTSHYLLTDIGNVEDDEEDDFALDDEDDEDEAAYEDDDDLFLDDDENDDLDLEEKDDHQDDDVEKDVIE